jgi:hypothetical protein
LKKKKEEGIEKGRNVPLEQRKVFHFGGYPTASQRKKDAV